MKTRLIIAALLLAPLVVVPPAHAAAGPNLAAGKAATASSSNGPYTAGNLNDGNQASYWESANNTFPQWAQIDLGTPVSIDRVVLKLPAGWGSRTQTLSVQASADGTSFSTLSSSAGRLFNPAVTIDFPAANARYVRVHITANTGWPAGQISEFEVYGPGPGSGLNLAVNKPITASGFVHTFVPANANDNSVTTYWEGNANPSTLTVQLGADAGLSEIVLKLNPDPVWGTRTQNIQILGRAQGASQFSSLVDAANYTFNPASGNTVRIPVGGTAADVRLQINSNTGAPAGQVAEFEVFGTPAPNPDLTVTGVSWAPASPVETDAITVSATVRNGGNLGSGATNVGIYLGTTLAGTANVGPLAAGASTTVSASIGTRNAGSYQVTAKVDENNSVIERDETNNAYTHGTALVVNPVSSSDLVASPVAWAPSVPSAGSTVTFTVALKNQGTIASAGGAHGITLTVLNASGGTVTTLTGAHSGTIGMGQTTAPVNLGTWTAANGRYTVRVVIANDAHEVPVKQSNNTSERPFFVGRGANMPYDMYEAEDGTVGAGASIIGPNRTVGDPAGEASGRRAVTLGSTGSYVEWTTRASSNTLVLRFSMPDAAGGGGINSSLNIYVDGAFHKAIDLTSRYAWLYGAEASPGNSPGQGAPRHIYDEANVMLNSSIPPGSRIRLQKDAANTSTYTVDFINLEQVSPRANPDPARYRVPAGFTHQDVQGALDAVRMDTTGNLVGVYLPAGTYSTSQKFQIYGKPVRVVGAGMWYTRFQTPPAQDNTDAGFRVESTANGSSFEHLAFFGNYTSRIDGPGKVWGELVNVANLTIDSVWVEHTVCAYWGVHNDRVTIRNSRFRNTFADAVNFTNGTTNSLVTNNEGRGNGDDAFALFSAADAGGGANTGNVFENLTATLTWRAAGVAVYGGHSNTFRNLYIADQLVYSGITISSLDFGYPFVGFGPPVTTFQNISIVRSGGHFWGNQTFPAIWCFAATHAFRGIRVSDVDIVDPTYSGIMFQTKYPEQTPITDTVFTNISISGAQKSGDAFDAKSGFGIWVNELPEQGQGPAIGSATFSNLRFGNNFQNIRNTTSTFTLAVN